MRSKQMFKANSSKNSLQFQRFGTAPKPRLMNEGNVGRIDEPDDGIIERRDFR